MSRFQRYSHHHRQEPQRPRHGHRHVPQGRDTHPGQQGGAGALGNIGGGADAGGDSAGGEEAADAASSVLSDANAKTAQNASSGPNWRSMGIGIGQGMANAGAVAQGKQPAKWEDINKDNAKNAAEKVVKSWRKKDFSKASDDPQNAQPANVQQGQ